MLVELEYKNLINILHLKKNNNKILKEKNIIQKINEI